MSEDAAQSARPIRTGDVLHLTRAASPQFVRPLILRVVRELTDRHTYHGWTWVEGYRLATRGQAVAKRELFVLREGLRWLPTAVPDRQRASCARKAGTPR
ncbi:hypothetical protein KBX71_19080 [Micromonospora sp. D93]|uniref:hypothetical protein n=1 Tax=Micromonospora sp. D93 TaxID=2824886 RepID=UPI001B37FBAA|nr:hypothetical protein [Micromonospora sp. D93]MBQ1019952.1 hypothetical protein [Micromonospora sp. D93]